MRYFIAISLLCLCITALGETERFSPFTVGWTVDSTCKPGELYFVSTFNDFEAYQSKANSIWSSWFDDCMSKPEPRACAKREVLGKVPNPYSASSAGGEPVNFLVNVQQTNVLVDGSSSTSVFTCAAERIVDCPTGSYRGWIESEAFCLSNDTPESSPFICPRSEFGNPISASTGTKLESAIDYSSADGRLKVERFYAGQKQGWNFLNIPKLVDLTGSIQQAQCAKSGILKYDAYDVAAQKIIEFKKYVCINYAPTASPEVIVTFSNGYRSTFNGTAGEFSGLYGERLFLHDGEVLKWEFESSQKIKYYFNAAGVPVKSVFPDGDTIYFGFDGDQLTSISDAFGRTISIKYQNGNAFPDYIELPDGGVIDYQYSNFPIPNTLSKVLWADGSSIEYLYNEQGLLGSSDLFLSALTGKVDSYNNRIGFYKYDSSGRAISTVGPLGVNKFELSGFGSSTSVTGPRGSINSINFTTLSNGTKVISSQSQPAGSGCAASTKNFQYTTDGLVEKKTEFNGNITLYGYETATKLENRRVEGLRGTADTSLLSDNVTLPVGSRKISTQWHNQFRKKTKVAEPKLITSYIYNGDLDSFNGNQIANCAPAEYPSICHKVVQATTDINGAQGFNAELDQNYQPREEYYTYNQWGQQLTFARSVGAVNEVREYYPDTTANWTKGDLKSVTNALGQKTEFTRYDANGRVLAFVDANGIETSLTYDARGRLLTQSRNGDATSYHYDLNGNKTGVDLPNGVSITYVYDLAKRLTDVVDSTGNKISYEYDVENNLKFQRIYNASGDLKYIKENVYDALSRVQQSLNSASQGSTLFYDANGNPTGAVDAKQQQTTNTYNALDQLATSENPLNGTTTFGYDGAGNLASVQDPKGNTTSYTYNPFGEIETLVSPDTGATSYTYDAAGNRTSSTDARSVVANYHYDVLNRLTSVEYPASPAENITYGYDATANDNMGVGHLTSIVTTKVRLDYEYNYQGLVSKKYTQVANSFNSTSYHYDAAGNLSGITYPSGREVSYERDSTGRISAIKTKADAGAAEQTLVSAITYMPFGPVKDYVYGNGLSMISQYDLDYRLTHIDVGSVFNRDYGFDAVNNITNILDNLTTSNQVFGYDALNRLTSANGTYGDLGYTYDAVGNRLTETRNSLTDTYNYPATNNRLSSITRSQGNRDFTYDGAGNPTARTAEDGSSQTLSFNNANRLDSISVNGNLAATYIYNPLGQRIVKELANGSKEIYHYDEAGQLIAISNDLGETLREYIYLGNQPIALVSNTQQSTISAQTLDEAGVSFQGSHLIATNHPGYLGTGFIDYVGEGSTSWSVNIPESTSYNLVVRYGLVGANRPLTLKLDGVTQGTINFSGASAWTVWNTTSLAVTLPAGQHTLSLHTTGKSGPNIDQLELVATNPVTTATSTLYYIHSNHLDTPQVVTNQTQQVVWMGSYEPFGKLTESQTNSIELFSRFPGQYLDKESGLYYNYFRDYDPSIGRYIESDPIGLEGGINTYGYVYQNPLRYIDPFGLDVYCYWSENMGNSVRVCEDRPDEYRPSPGEFPQPGGCVTAECAAQVPPVPPPATPEQKCKFKCNMLLGLICGPVAGATTETGPGAAAAILACRAAVYVPCAQACKDDDNSCSLEE